MAIRCMVVTPERTELDAEVKFLVLPMYDGELGVAPGRSAMIGRLGYGVLRLQTEQGFQRFFVDGGFAQIENDTVSILTGKAQPIESLDLTAAEASLEEALVLPGGTVELTQIRDTAVRRARGLVRAAKAAK